MGGDSSSSSSSHQSTSNTDNKIAAEAGSFVATTQGGNGDIYIEQAPQELLDFTSNAINGAGQLVTRAMDIVDRQSATTAAVAQGSPVEAPSNTKSRNNALLMGVSVLTIAYLLRN
ncbi:hypothetical protein [Polycladidibacter hongkongensis]|uniref:hypothetical protein n=1 Tax=Polycladidibacter hongkongensis TaxID=1647556 RepID=UPI00082DE635|nr:hypothetical protein [Pseudovibrio hongkongensis]